MVPSTNAAWQQRSLQSVWHPCTQMQHAHAQPPIPIARAQGAWLYDYEGNRYFDGISSWWVNLFGHANAHINAAVHAQLDTLPHTMLAGCTHAPAVELAEQLAARTQGHLGHAFYGSDGASAVEIALKISFHYWRNMGHGEKNRFICLRGSYHGETLGALGVTDVALFRAQYDALLRPPFIIESPATRDALALAAQCETAVQALEQTLQSHHGEIAALILEPLVQAAAGILTYPPEYLRRARALCTQYGVHLIADEIAVGCGRTGKFFAWDYALPADRAVTAEDYPDLMTLSKGITGGTLALSVVLCKHSIYEAFLSPEVQRGFLHSHSYTGNPLACAAALATLSLLDDAGLADIGGQCELLQRALAPITRDERLIHPRQIGSIWAIDIHPQYAKADCAQQLHRAALAHELLIRPIGNTVYLMPPLVLNEALCEHLGHALQQSLNCL